jgi:hypothetical protein
MKTIFLMVMASALVAFGQTYEPKSVSGSTAAVATWDGRSGQTLRLTTVDCTSDKAASVIAWRVGQAPLTVAAAAATTVTNLTTLVTAGTQATLAANDVVLIQNAAGAVTNKTVHSVELTTNKLSTVIQPWGTNLAAGATFREKLPTAYTVLAPAASDATALLMSSLTGLAADDVLVLQKGQRVWSDAVAAVATNANFRVPLDGGAPTDLAYGDPAYTRGIATLVLATNAADGTSLHVLSAVGFSNDDPVLIQTARGDMVVVTASTVATTNLTIGAPGFEVVPGDLVWRLTNTCTVGFPTEAGARSIWLTASNGVSTGALVVDPAAETPWMAGIAGAATPASVYLLTLAASFGEAAIAGDKVYKCTTNVYTLLTASGRASTTAVTTNVIGLATGDEVVAFPGTGGAALNRWVASETQILNRVNLTAAVGLAISVGDTIYSSTTQSTPLGAATLRLTGATVLAAPQGRPAILTVDGTTACAINNAVGVYQ